MALKWKYSCRKNDQKSIFPYSLNIHASCIIFLMRKEKVCMFDIYFQIAVYIKACVYIYVTCTIENRLTTNKISILDPTCFGYCLHRELYLWCIFSNWYILLKGVYIYVFCKKENHLTASEIFILHPTCFGHCLHQGSFHWFWLNNNDNYLEVIHVKCFIS